MKSLVKTATISIIFHLICITLYAQSNVGGFPLVLTTKHQLKSNASPNEDFPTICMPNIENNDVLQEIEEQRKLKKACGNKFAHQFSTNISLKEQGDLTVLTDELGRKNNVWRLKIQSKTALSLNLIFKNLQLSSGAKLYLYSPDQNQILGAYTQANNTNFAFATSPVEGENIVIQLEEPEAQPSESPVITKVNHGVKTLPGFRSSYDCEVDATHDQIHIDQRRSACLLIINGQTFCSGNLIDNTRHDGMPYIISSNHCFWETDSHGNSKLDTTLAHTLVTFFNYESPVAGWPVRGSMEMSLSGGYAMAYNKQRDMILIRMKEIPAPDFRPYMSGWNATEEIPVPVYAFHHPDGDLKKVSMDEEEVHTGDFDHGITFEKNMHWQIDLWNEGLTERGSSGCGLFDANGRIVGSLSGGDTDEDCDKPGLDLFWKICENWHKTNAYNKALSPWLDPDQTGATICDGHELYSNPCIRVTNRKENDELTCATNEDKIALTCLTSKDGLIEIAEKFVQPTNSSIYGIYFIPCQARYSTKSPYEVCICKETTDKDGNKIPGDIIHQQTLKITATEYYSDIFAEEFSNTTINQWNGKENYIRLDSVIKADSVFYVVFRIGDTKQNIENYEANPFSLSHSSARSKTTDNTAYYKKEDIWHPFHTHPEGIGPISLMTDVVLRKGWDIKDEINPVIPEFKDSSFSPYTPDEEFTFSLYPGISKDGIIHITIPKNEKLCSVVVSDVNGHLIMKKEGLSETNVYMFDLFENSTVEDGVYIVRANYQFQSKSYKFFVKKQTP